MVLKGLRHDTEEADGKKLNLMLMEKIDAAMAEWAGKPLMEIVGMYRRKKVVTDDSPKKADKWLR